MPWYGKVEYCPYCGKDVAAVSVKPKAIDAAIDMVEVSATPTVMAVEVEEASRNPRHLPSETGVAKSRKNIQIATAKQEPKQTESVSNAVHQEVSVPSSPAQPIGTLPDGAVSLTQDKSIPKIAVASILIILIVIFFAFST